MVRKVEARRHDSDHSDGLAVESNAPAHDVGGTAEPPPPETIAQDRDFVAAGPLFFREKGAAPRGHPAEQLEEVGGDDRALQPFRLTTPRQREAVCRIPCDGTERATPRTHVHEEGIRIVDDRKAHLGRRSPEADDSVGIVERQGIEERRVDDAEDGDVGADANRQGEQRNCREGGTPPQSPHAIAHVVPDSKEPALGGRLPERRRVLHGRTFERSERSPEDVRRRQLVERGPPRLIVRDAGFQEFGVAIVEMLRQFLDDVVDVGRVGCEAREACPQFGLPIRT